MNFFKEIIDKSDSSMTHSEVYCFSLISFLHCFFMLYSCESLKRHFLRIFIDRYIEKVLAEKIKESKSTKDVLHQPTKIRTTIDIEI